MNKDSLRATKSRKAREDAGERQVSTLISAEAHAALESWAVRYGSKRAAIEGRLLGTKPPKGK